MAIKKIYQDLLASHYHAPRHRGRLSYATHQSGVVNPSCGDEVSVYLVLCAQDRVEEIAFEGKGCMISQATASILAEQVLHKSKTEILELTSADLQKLVGDGFGPTRWKCVILALQALQEALK